MKFVAFALVIFFSTVGGVFAQSGEKEVINLRKQIKIPDKDILRSNENAKLPAGDSLKIFQAIKRSGSEAEHFEKWVEEWNKEDGDKYGKLEAVEDISKADVILTQFVSSSIKQVGEASVKVGNIPSPEQSISQKTKIKVKNEVGYKPLPLPVYSYLITREDDVWTTIYQDVESSLPNEQLLNPELRLWRAFKEEMKAR
ncbi:MAG: hypothetical protein M3R14_10045 [Acidobacteriota bacterium]|nr:hypothetical protein [Acidobacteriota bacterium]